MLVLLASSSVSAFALDMEPSYADKKHPYMDYYFESYDVSINVLENNTLEITEKISAYFNVEKHGIFRKSQQQILLNGQMALRVLPMQR